MFRERKRLTISLPRESATPINKIISQKIQGEIERKGVFSYFISHYFLDQFESSLVSFVFRNISRGGDTWEGIYEFPSRLYDLTHLYKIPSPESMKTMELPWELITIREWFNLYKHRKFEKQCNLSLYRFMCLHLYVMLVECYIRYPDMFENMHNDAKQWFLCLAKQKGFANYSLNEFYLVPLSHYNTSGRNKNVRGLDLVYFLRKPTEEPLALRLITYYISEYFKFKRKHGFSVF